MKKYVSVAIFAMMSIPCYGALSENLTPVSCSVNFLVSDLPTGCADASRVIRCSTATYYDCTACDDGYTLGSSSVVDGSTTYTYGTCTNDFSGVPIPIPECPDECPSTTEWTATTRFREAICVSSGSLFDKSCSYRCIKGYYMGELGCVQCPSSGGIYGTTAAAGATSITECYIPAGTTRSFSDGTGAGTEKFTSNCYYSE